MRLLSGRARETEIKLSVGFQSGPGADSDFWTSLGSREDEAGGMGLRAATRSFTLSLAKCSYSQSKTKYPCQAGHRTRGHEAKGQRAKGRGQQAFAETYRRCASLGQHARLPLPPVPTRPVACDVDNTKLLVK